MCIALPMQVLRADEFSATCTWQGAERVVDTFLLNEPLKPGDWLLVFHESAREKISAERAEQVSMALQALDLVMSGELPAEQLDARIEALFPDLPQQRSSRSETP